MSEYVCLRAMSLNCPCLEDPSNEGSGEHVLTGIPLLTSFFTSTHYYSVGTSISVMFTNMVIFFFHSGGGGEDSY